MLRLVYSCPTSKRQSSWLLGRNICFCNRGRLGRERKIASRGETEGIDSRRRAPIGVVLLKQTFRVSKQVKLDGESYGHLLVSMFLRLGTFSLCGCLSLQFCFRIWCLLPKVLMSFVSWNLDRRARWILLTVLPVFNCSGGWGYKPKVWMAHRKLSKLKMTARN